MYAIRVSSKFMHLSLIKVPIPSTNEKQGVATWAIPSFFTADRRLRSRNTVPAEMREAQPKPSEATKEKLCSGLSSRFT